MTHSDMITIFDIASHVPVATSCSYPARPGNLVRPLVDGVPTFRRIAEAITDAQHSLWLTVAFYADDFRFPDDGETLFDTLDHAVSRGLDVRVLFWRPNQQSSGYGRTFSGTGADLEILRARGTQFNIRWDQAHAAFCQHQKSWIIDAGHAGETSFIGGINLTAKALGVPGHRDGGQHDLYVEVAGPSATDVHHNFVQRWNEASERGKADGLWGPQGAATLPFPSRTSEPRGSSVVQIQRMVHPGRYTDSHPTPGGIRQDISRGERSILEQYEQAIDAARSSIYIENQAVPIPAVARRLESALQRGVEVVVLVPAEPETSTDAARRSLSEIELFNCLEALSHYENFALVGLIVSVARNTRAVYVHAKAMLVDDTWATIGSCNLHSNSLGGGTEMNASIWDPVVARRLRCELLTEHLDKDTSTLDDRAALRLLRETAEHNRSVMKGFNAESQGLVVSLETSEYGSRIS